MSDATFHIIPTEEKAFRAFFDTHHSVMVSFAMNYVSDQDQAEELVQQGNRI